MERPPPGLPHKTRSQKQTEHERRAGRRRSAGPIRATDRAAAGWTDWPSRRGPRRVPLKGWPPSQGENCANAARHARDPCACLPFQEVTLHDLAHTDVLPITRANSARSTSGESRGSSRSPRRVVSHSSAAKSDCMDYEEELDDNGVLRIRRVASPFVPIRDEREAPPMAFDDDQMKAFRMVTLRKLQNQTRGARLTLCPPLATDLRPLRRNALRSCHRLHPNRRYGHSAPLRWPEPNPDRTRRPLRGGESGRPLS